MPLLCAAPALAAPVPREDERTKVARAFGVWSAPDRDCSFTLKGDRLRVTLFGGEALCGQPRVGSADVAPRALREVEGDFVAVVRVVVPAAPKDADGPCSFRSGALVAWESDKQHVVIRRCAGNIDGNREPVWTRLTADGKLTECITDTRRPGEAAFLRIRRDDNTVAAAWSRDGELWRAFGSFEVAWGAKVKVGIAAENGLGTPTEITFDRYSLTVPKK